MAVYRVNEWKKIFSSATKYCAKQAEKSECIKKFLEALRTGLVNLD